MPAHSPTLEMEHAGASVDLTVGQIRRIGSPFGRQLKIRSRMKLHFFPDRQIRSPSAFIPQFQIFSR